MEIPALEPEGNVLIWILYVALGCIAPLQLHANDGPVGRIRVAWNRNINRRTGVGSDKPVMGKIGGVGIPLPIGNANEHPNFFELLRIREIKKERGVTFACY